MQNYRAFNSSRPNSRSGGVAILFSNNISRGITQFHTNITPDAVIAKLSKHYFNTKSDTYIITFYFSPSNSKYRKRLTDLLRLRLALAQARLNHFCTGGFQRVWSWSDTYRMPD